MNKLKIKCTLCLLFITIGIALLQGCGDRIDDGEIPAFSFIDSVQVVDVNEDTKSFRIIGKWTSEGNRHASFSLLSPQVHLDRRTTTALHNEHFVNYVDPIDRSIGEFTALDSDTIYRDVELIPKNIITEKIIYYGAHQGSNYDHLAIRRLKVILRPKANN